MSGGSMFQSAPGFSAGRNAKGLPPVSTPFVSIRSRLFGREKPAACSMHRQAISFQSAPGFSAGRNHPCDAGGSRCDEFQSAPGFSAGRNKMRRGGELLNVAVSIRSRLFGREKPGRRSMRGASRYGFNPLPAFRPGETELGGV